MEPIRLATPEEVESIRETSDLTPGSTVVAFPGGHGTSLAVIRRTVEIDPMHYGEGCPANRKALFVWGLENMLRFMGNTEYYFNVRTEDEAYRQVVQHWGAQQISVGPELRFKKVL